MTEQEKLVDMLDDVTASLETVLLHQGKQMTPADYAARKALAVKARNLVSSNRDVGDIAPVDAKEWHAEFHTHHQPGMTAGRAERIVHIVHLWDEYTSGCHIETHTDEIAELVMDYSDATWRQHASILAGSIRVLKAAEGLLIDCNMIKKLREELTHYVGEQMQELADAVKVSLTPFQEK